ncbi:unnamed protein product, partial [Heterotrigona itama]
NAVHPLAISSDSHSLFRRYSTDNNKNKTDVFCPDQNWKS